MTDRAINLAIMALFAGFLLWAMWAQGLAEAAV